MWTRRKTDKGFTLLEILIAMGLVGVALLAVFRLQAQNLDLQAEARFLTIANCLLQERLSRIQSEEAIEEGTVSGDFGEDFPDFTWEQEVAQEPDMEHLFKVKVRVVQGREKATKDLGLDTHVYRKEK